MRKFNTLALPFIVVLATAAFTACPPKPGPGPNPPPVTIDATVDGDVDSGSSTDDAAPAGDASAPDALPSTLACRNACAALTAIGCPHGDPMVCAAVLTDILSDGHIGNPQTRGILTCDQIAAVRTKIDAMGLGFKCP